MKQLLSGKLLSFFLVVKTWNCSVGQLNCSESSHSYGHTHRAAQSSRKKSRVSSNQNGLHLRLLYFIWITEPPQLNWSIGTYSVWQQAYKLN